MGRTPSVRILLTNDDGIDAEGLNALAHRLADWADLSVVAPDAERSASGHSITLKQPLVAEPRRLHAVDQAWAIGGTPADCVKLALEVLLPQFPDLVISGINHGSNLGRDVFYSGTVSAAIEASFLGVPALAVSLTRPNSAGLAWGAGFVRWWLEHAFVFPPSGVIYNLNLPEYVGTPPTQLVPASLGRRVYRNQFRLETTVDGRRAWWLGGEPLVEDEAPDSDVAVVARGQIALTPIRLEVTADDVLHTMEPMSFRIAPERPAILPKRGGGAHRA
jgi:5'-nucleotidase